MGTSILSVFCGAVLLAASCSHGGGEPQKPSPCADVLCTADYRTITVAVRDGNGAAVDLDSNYTTDAGGTRLSPAFYAETATGDRDAVLNDNWAADHKNTTAEVVFIGFKSGKQVVRQAFTVQTDCCHIAKQAGPDAVTASL